MSIWAFIGVLAAILWFLMNLFFSIKDIPDDMVDLKNEVGRLNMRMGSSPLDLILFKGGGVVGDPTVEQGGTIKITFLVSRKASCDTDILVQFFNHKTNLIENRHSYIIPSIKSPVTEEFIPFTVPLYVPVELPSSVYSYTAKIKPIECGAYKEFLAPMSDPFFVEKGDIQ